VILDNLIADQKIEPMIVVFPNGNATTNTGGAGRGGGRGGFGSGGDAAEISGPGWGKDFESDLIKDIIPFIETHYSVYAGPRTPRGGGAFDGRRPIARLRPGQPRHVRERRRLLVCTQHAHSRDVGSRSGQGQTELKVLWISCGNKDGLMTFSLRTHTYLKEKNVPHIWHVDDNGHDFKHWKNSHYCSRSKSSIGTAGESIGKNMKTRFGLIILLALALALRSPR